MVKRLVIIAAALVCCAAAAQAGVFCVKVTGSDMNSGSGWDCATKTVQAAIDASATGDEVWVAAGVYPGKITIKSGVALYGGFAGTESSRQQRDPKANTTVLDGSGSYGIVKFADNSTAASILDGFTLRNAGENCAIDSGFQSAATISNNILVQEPMAGTGIACSAASTATISGNTVSGYRKGIWLGNKASVSIVGNTLSDNDKGVYCDQVASPRVAGNTFTHNSFGLYFYSVSSPVITGNLVAENGMGMYITGASAEILGNIIRSNGGYTGLTGGGISLASCAAKVVGNTIVDNRSSAQGGAISCQAITGQSTIVNNIVAANSSGVYVYGTGPAPLIHNNCLFQNGGQDIAGTFDPALAYANLFVDPKLADLHRHNTHIQPDSPCVGNGDNSIVTSGSTDIDGQPRIQPTGGTIDIGADESDGTWWPVGPGFKVIRVKSDGNDSDDGSSWTGAKRTVQAAIDSATSADEIWVAAGTYHEHPRIYDAVALYGGFCGSEESRDSRDYKANASIIDGDSAGTSVVRIATRSDVAARVDGFTIQHGSGTFGCGIYIIGGQPVIANNTVTENVSTSNGGGIKCDSGAPTIIGNIISRNSTYAYGGGISCWLGSATIRDNVVSENSAYDGGGIYCDIYSTVGSITGNRIVSNTATWDDSAISSRSTTVVIANNIVAENRGAHDAIGGSPKLVLNNTIVGNDGTALRVTYSAVHNNVVAFNGSGILADASDLGITNNCVYGNTNETGMTSGTDPILQDPKLVNRATGDYHVPSDSPCVNAGNSHLNALPATDMEGRPRLLCGAVDIGAYELPNLAPPLTSLASARQASQHTWVKLTGQAVSASFGGPFYIQSPDRACGMRVENAPCTVAAGMQVDLEGIVHTNDNGECCIDAIADAASPGKAVLPVALSSSNLGGGTFGPQKATWRKKKSPETGLFEWYSDSGLNTVGRLVKVWGRVTQIHIGDLYFYVDDGCARRDGSQSWVLDGSDYQLVNDIGIYISKNPAGLHEGQTLCITGVVSCWIGPDYKLVPQILPVSVQVVGN